MPPFTLTTPLYYVNARPHLGHAYSTIAADVMTRFQRQQGREAFLLTGTDEHGQKIERVAAARAIAPQTFADQVSAAFRAEWDRLGVHYDAFIRTTEPRHTRAVIEVFERLRQNGAIYKGSYSGPYCVSDELFVGEGKVGDPCPLCGRPTELVSEENYYFRLSEYGDRLLELYQNQPDFIRPETRRNEVIAFVKAGLKDVSITRTSITWGIPVPGDEKHVLYVWFDALIGYLSGMGYASLSETDRARWEHLWPAWHLVGKEIVRFHCVYWPAFLMAAGLPLPRGIIAHGWLLFDEAKMSKSVGNVVRPEPIRKVLGADALRYFLLREVSFGQDGNFSFPALIDRYNADLANGWGNLASRTLAMIHKYRAGIVPPRRGPTPPLASSAEFIEHMENWQFSRALESVWSLIAETDRYISSAKPWDLAKNNDPKLDDVLRDAYEVLRWTAALLAPILPDAAARLWTALGLPGHAADINPSSLVWDAPPIPYSLVPIPPLFPRADKEKTMEELQKSDQPSAVSPQPEAPISIDDFAKVHMRVGTILTAERIPKADKLLKLTVDIGTEVRTIASGIAQYYEPEALLGRKVVIVANLAPRTLRGIDSNGMIVAASLPDGRAVLVAVPDEVPNGTLLK